MHIVREYNIYITFVLFFCLLLFLEDFLQILTDKKCIGFFLLNDLPSTPSRPIHFFFVEWMQILFDVKNKDFFFLKSQNIAHLVEKTFCWQPLDLEGSEFQYLGIHSYTQKSRVRHLKHIYNKIVENRIIRCCIFNSMNQILLFIVKLMIYHISLVGAATISTYSTYYEQNIEIFIIKLAIQQCTFKCITITKE